MTKQNKTKNALIMSTLSLVLCFAMLVGSTFAWFTDSATTGVNKIVAGNLDIDLYKGTVADNKITYEEVIDDQTLLFNNDALWEPGYTEVAYIKVENVGTLALKALLTVNFAKQVAGINVEGNEFLLSSYLKYDLVEIADGEFYATRDEARTTAEADSKLIATEQNEINLDAGAPAKYYALVVYMPENVGNEANYRDVAPSIELCITLLATQDTVENDSWDNLYDKDSEYPSSIKNNEGLYEALKTSDNVTIKNGNYELPIDVAAGKTVNVEGGDFSSTNTGISTPAFSVGANANLTISTSDVTATEYNVAVVVNANGGNLTINEGTYASSSIQVFQITGNSESNNATITINGGSITGTVGVWCDDADAVIVINGGEFNIWALVMGDSVPTTPVSITGGTFKISGTFDADQGTPFVITGGTFNQDPSQYVDTDAYNVTEADGWWTVTAK